MHTQLHRNTHEEGEASGERERERGELGNIKENEERDGGPIPTVGIKYA